MKTKEELNALREEIEALNAKLAELTEEELQLVTGGKNIRHGKGKNIIGNPVLGKPALGFVIPGGEKQFDPNFYNKDRIRDDFEPGFGQE